MQRQPNILIILADGMQAETVESDHQCETPFLQSLQERGVNFRRAHTTCPTCSPARASLMTGLLPHNHGVLEVEHGRDDDQCVLRTEFPHFAQHLSSGGYRTAYFGKWHIERSYDVSAFGWSHSVVKGAEHLTGIGRGQEGPRQFELDESLCGYVEGPRGYKRILHWGVTDTPLNDRYPGVTVRDAEQFIDGASADQPWCCCVSFSEPNEALVVGRDEWNRYDRAGVDLPANFFDDMSQRPNIYQREQEIGRHIPESHWRSARACYFGRITEIDQLTQRLVERVGRRGELNNTIVIFMADHGRYVGAHGFDAHNFGAFEEIYRIPLIIAGPGVAENEHCDGLVSIADIGPTLCELAEGPPFDYADSRSFSSLLRDPTANSPDFANGYAEYHGTRFPLMQRILWRDDWKFVFNGFDFDEL
ncbi:MAG: sulfatase-like hydrolase/transferase, partial [Pirellulaceae bacterium]|nr:sulfatase-like hydrolase/transferase [Pirellulaceae bacterium]